MTIWSDDFGSLVEIIDLKMDRKKPLEQGDNERLDRLEVTCDLLLDFNRNFGLLRKKERVKLCAVKPPTPSDLL